MSDDLTREDDDVKLYTTKQVASLCEVTQHTVRQWIARGEIKHIWLGGQYRIRKPDLLEFLNHKYAN